jgi:hypothetical protein
VRLSFLIATAIAAPLLVSAPVRADGLSVDETDKLVRGDAVVRRQSLGQHDRRYVGGVTYAIIDGDADDVAGLLGDLDVWRRILPKTRSARRVGTAGDDALLELTHGSALVQATYTMRVRRQGRVVRFWLDPQRPHDIEDAWGFVRAQPLAGGRTLVTYGVLIDLGPGLLRDLFEDRVRELALSVPERMRDLVLERNAAGQRASQ